MNSATTDKKKFYVIGLFVTLVLAGVVSFYASSSPDGLEKVADKIGFIDTAKDHALAEGPLADYGVKGIENERLSVGMAGVIGVLATGVVSTGLFFVLRRKSN
jgi:cobalt/nickel transport protein